MHDHGNADARAQRAVLGLVLYRYTQWLYVYDLRREIGEEADAAIRDLQTAGLLHREGDYVRPTRPALSFHLLESS